MAKYKFTNKAVDDITRIFYRKMDETEVEITRILHEQMDLKNRIIEK